MPELVKDGKRKFFSAGDLRKAIQAGWRFDTNKPVDLLVEGSLKQVSADDAYKLIGVPGVSEFTAPVEVVEREERVREAEFESTGAQIAGFAEGVGRTASLGLSDLVKTGVLGENPYEVRQRRERNAASIAGELIGAAPSLFVGGIATQAPKAVGLVPAGQAALLGQAVNRAVGAGTLGTAAGLATEGALFGVGQSISNLALTNKPLTAEAVVSELGWNTLVGAGLGALTGATIGGITSYAKGVKAARETKELAETTFSEAKDSLRGTFRELRTISQVAQKEARKAKAFNPSLFSSKLSSYTKAEESLAESLQSIIGANAVSKKLVNDTVAGSAKASLQELEKAQALRSQMEVLTVGSGGGAKLSKLVKQYEATFGRSLKRFERISGTAGIDDSLASAARAELDTAKAISVEQTPVLNPEQLVKLQLLQDDVSKLTGNLDTLAPKEVLKGIQSIQEYQNELKALDSAIGGTLSPRIDSALDNLAVKINRVMPDLAGESGLMQANGKHLIDMFAVAAGADLEGDLLESLPVVGPVADSILKLWLASRVLGVGGASAAKRVAGLSKNPWLNKAQKVLKDTAYRAGGRIGSRLGRQQSIVPTGAGDAVGFSLGSNLASSAVDAVSGTASGLGGITNKVSQALSDTVTQLERPLKTAGKAVAPSALTVFSRITGDSSGTEAEQLSRVVKAMQFKSEMLNMEAIAQGNVEVAELARQQLAAISQYLLEVAPKDPRSNPSLLGYGWVPSKSETIKFVKQVNAATNPTSVIVKVNSGTVDPVEAEAIQRLYPSMLHELQLHVLENMQRVLKAPRQKLINLSILLGQPIGYDPHVVTTIQQGYAMNKEQKAQPQPRPFSRNTEPTTAQTLVQP